MMSESKELQDLKKLLIAERAMLLAGDMDGVGAIAKQKEVLICQIQRSMHLKNTLASNFMDLKSDISRNLELLSIAVQTIRETKYIYSHRNAGASLVSYTADGSTLPLPPAQNNLQRKY